jgi:hypothetical protein
MRHRSLLHVGGPPGAGKTTFIEALLAANDEEAFFVVRARRDASRRVPRTTSRIREVEGVPELRRYLNAGAMTAVGYAFGSANVDDFFMSEFMQDYSTAVVIEGDDPIGLADLNVHVLAALAEPVLVRQERKAAPVDLDSALLALLAEAGISSDSALRLADDAGRLRGGVVKPVWAREAGPERSGLGARPRAAPPAAPSTTWTISDTHQGIAQAQLVVVNVRGDDERQMGDARLAELVRLRGDPEVFADLRFRFAGGRTPITAVAADLTNRKDPGTRKALARVRRTLRSAS